jgi:three-Cys-motif partner protein
MAKESLVGSWAKDKLECLRKYLSAYTKIMKKRTWCRGYHYIDAFAGPGSHKVRTADDNVGSAQRALLEVAEFGAEQKEQQRFLAGSPRVALDIDNPFTNYVFVEKSPERVKSLKKLVDEYLDRRTIHIRERDCSEYLQEMVAKNPEFWKSNRAVVFLDPFGMQVGWPTIEALASTKAIEIFLNLPVGMAIQRLLRTRPEKYSEPERRKLDDYFGSPKWFDALYKKSAPPLFGEGALEKVKAPGKALLKWYRERLAGIFAHVSNASLIRNTKRGHLYYLMLASPDKTGVAVKIANDILSAGETVKFR